jgi:hypothetical protein
MTSMRKEEVQKTNETFQELKDRINDKNYELSIVYRKNLAYKQDNIEKEKIIKDLKERYVDIESKLKSVEGEKLLLKTMNNNQVEIMKSEINLLKTSLDDVGQTIKQINIYRDALDNWKFINEKNYNTKSPVDLISIAKNDRKETLLIYEQLSAIMNNQIEEYDSQLERLKQKKDNSVINYDQYLEELQKVMDGFKNRVKNLFDEQEQLRSHYRKLNEIISNYINGNRFSKTNILLDNINKMYSIMVVYSEDHGYTYKVINNVEFCHKCKAKTVLCPHKKFDITYEIPVSATNIRIVHPDLFIWKPESNIVEEVDNTIETEDIDGKTIDVKEITKLPTYQKIWNYFFFKQNGVKPALSREYSYSKLVAIIWEVFNARYVVEEDPNFMNQEHLKTFTESFFTFINKKYIIEKISKYVLHDIIKALQENENLPIVTLFSRTLSGEEDCSWKYYYILSQFIRSYNNFNSNNVSKIFKTIYPMKNESFYEEIEFDYQSFCKAKSTKETFLDYILFLIKKQAEPNYLFFLEILHRYDHRNNGYLEFAEYIEFANQMIPKASYNTVELQYRISEQITRRSDRVPLERLSYITCFLFVLSVKKNFRWKFVESLTKEYINHSNASYLENVNIEELNRIIEKAKQDTIDPEAVENEEKKMSERVDQLLKRDGIDMEVVNDCIKNGKPIPEDIANEIINRECSKRFPSNTNLKAQERADEILANRTKIKLFGSNDSITEDGVEKTETKNNNNNNEDDGYTNNNNTENNEDNNNNNNIENNNTENKGDNNINTSNKESETTESNDNNNNNEKNNEAADTSNNNKESNDTDTNKESADNENSKANTDNNNNDDNSNNNKDTSNAETNKQNDDNNNDNSTNDNNDTGINNENNNENANESEETNTSTS